jgi:hypothetical protein
MDQPKIKIRDVLLVHFIQYNKPIKTFDSDGYSWKPNKLNNSLQPLIFPGSYIKRRSN